jgi:hypothetical protein
MVVVAGRALGSAVHLVLAVARSTPTNIPQVPPIGSLTSSTVAAIRRISPELGAQIDQRKLVASSARGRSGAQPGRYGAATADTGVVASVTSRSGLDLLVAMLVSAATSSSG